VTVTVNPAPPVNQPPTANAGPDQTLTLAVGQSSVAVTLNGSGSSDPDGTIATYNWTGTPDPANSTSPSVTLAAGSHTFTLVVTDNSGASSVADTVRIAINPAPPVNQPPTANAGPDQTLTLSAGQTSLAVTLNGSGSSDPDGTIATYNWTGTPDPANSARPSVTLAAGSYTFTLLVTDNSGATSVADTVRITVNPAPNQAPTASAGPDQTLTLSAGQSSLAVTLNSSGSSDADGSIASYTWTGTPDPANVASPMVTLSAGTYTFTLVVTDNAEATSAPDTVTITVNTPAQACAPDQVPTDAQLAHIQCITEYTGPEVCVACHEGEARDMHGSVHYQQNGLTDYVTNIDGLGGERGFDFAATGINTYCGTHENSPRFTCAGCHVGNGRFPKTPDQMNFPLFPFEFEDLTVEQQDELANIDCLTCHQEVYKRFPDPSAGFEDLVLENVALNSNGLLVESTGSTVIRTSLEGIPVVNDHDSDGRFDFLFVPADPTNPLLEGIPAGLMSITGLQAAQTVHPTTRKSCLNCHAGAAGADGAKRGDLNSLMANPSITLDRHMSPAGSDMTCSDCHSAGNHRMLGRGLDLRPNDVPPATSTPAGDQFACTACHTASTVHNAVTNGATFARHVAKVACQTCHIPTYGKGVATEVYRDWQDPHVSQTACNGRGGWLPAESKDSNLVPSYAWFDGTSEVYYLGESLVDVPTVPLAADVAATFQASAGPSAVNFDVNDPAFVLGVSAAIVDGSGAINKALGAKNPDAKIYPMKEHWGKLARHNDSNALIGHSTYEFFRTGDFDYAVEQGMAQSGLTGSYDVVPVHTFQTINHGVEPKANALGANNACGTCHDVAAFTTGKPLRMHLERDMGYAVTRAGITAGTNGSYTCSVSCHGSETGNFTNIHSRSQHRNAGCTACHANR
jgi:hypothetical protein